MTTTRGIYLIVQQYLTVVKLSKPTALLAVINSKLSNNSNSHDLHIKIESLPEEVGENSRNDICQVFHDFDLSQLKPVIAGIIAGWLQLLLIRRTYAYHTWYEL